MAVPCATRGLTPNITDIYAIHSYWSPERRHLAPAICDWFKAHGGPLADVPCTLFPGYWAANKTRDQIVDLIARRIVAPETHAKRQGLLTRLLYRLGLSSAVPLFDEDERVTKASFLGTAASHLLAVQNWTIGMVQRGIPPEERKNRHLLLFEDDAVLTARGMADLAAILPRLDHCYDVLGLDYKEGYCPSHTLSGALESMLWRGRRHAPPRLVPARLSYSRNTGLVMSYKGAMALLGGLPVTREIDLWYRDLMTDGALKIYVSCPRIVRNVGIPSVQ